jgi:diacylglycerol kinase
MKPALRSLIEAFSYAGAGIGYLMRSQRNARIHLALTVMAILLGLWLKISFVEWAVLSLTVGLVFLAEAFNTAIEATVDLASPTNHPLAKIAKDTAAGGVLLAAMMAVAVAVFLFLPHLWVLIYPSFQ